MIEPKDKQRILMEETSTDAFLSSLEAAPSCYSLQNNAISYKICEEATVMVAEVIPPDWESRNNIEDLHNISRSLEPTTFAQDSTGRYAYSKFGMSMGTMTG